MRELLKRALIPGTKVQVGTINQVLVEVKTERDFPRVEELIEKRQNENLYWLGGVDEEKEGRARDADITKKNYHFLDFDIRANYRGEISDDQIVQCWDWIGPALESEKLTEDWDFVVFTGNGLHVYYFYDEPWVTEKEEYAAAVAAFVKMAGHISGCADELDKGCINIARLSRLPSSYNQKTGKQSFIIDSRP